MPESDARSVGACAWVLCGCECSGVCVCVCVCVCVAGGVSGGVRARARVCVCDEMSVSLYLSKRSALLREGTP